VCSKLRLTKSEQRVDGITLGTKLNRVKPTGNVDGAWLTSNEGGIDGRLVGE
jgi:hypothetical protein